MGGGVEVADEGQEFDGDVNGGEKEVMRQVDTSGGAVCEIE